MRNIFVFTAGNKIARKHLKETFIKEISLGSIKKFFKPHEADRLEDIAKTHGLYAWGAIPGPFNERNWDFMNEGDYVFCVYGNVYHYITEVVDKFRNEECAKNLWGIDDSTQQKKTWELMYFVKKPTEINIPTEDLSDYLYRSYRGFTKISDNRTREIEIDFGSVNHFIKNNIQKYYT